MTKKQENIVRFIEGVMFIDFEEENLPLNIFIDKYWAEASEIINNKKRRNSAYVDECGYGWDYIYQ